MKFLISQANIGGTTEKIISAKNLEVAEQRAFNYIKKGLFIKNKQIDIFKVKEAEYDWACCIMIGSDIK